jgi:hypothetical protein
LCPWPFLELTSRFLSGEIQRSSSKPSDTGTISQEMNSVSILDVLA